MARIPLIKQKEDLPPDKQHVYEEIFRVRGRLGGPLTLFLHSPDIAARVAHLGNYVHYETSMDPVVMELLVLSTAREHDAQYIWTAHEPLARRVGVREEAIVAIRDRKALGGLPPDERVVIQYIRELLHRRRVSEPTFQAALARFGRPGLVEFTGVVGYYSLLSVTVNGFELEPGGGATPLLPV